MSTNQQVPDAAGELLAQADWIRKLARRLVHDAARAEDVAQDTLLAALKGQPRRGQPLGAWLAGITRNVAR